MRSDLARALADAFLAGERQAGESLAGVGPAGGDPAGGWTRTGLVNSGAMVLGRRRRWLGPLARQVLELYPRAPRDRPRELAAVIARLPAAAAAGPDRPVVRSVAATRMLTNPWRLVEMHDLTDLATLLGVTGTELDWFADPRHWARRTVDEPLRHYRVRTRVAASGAIRVLEAPKRRLKDIQRLLLREVFGRIPAHDAAHGFRLGRSVASYAAPHAGRAVVVRLDLEGFFASVSVGRVHGLLRTAGYPEPVAHALAGLTTTVLPLATWQRVPRPADPGLLDAHWRLGRRLAAPHLPQGAPTSPALANLAAYRLDIRLSALAAAWGGRYTRYADDLALSGGRSWRTGTSRLLDAVERIVHDEGFRLNARKTGVLPQGGRQVLGGLVVNDRPHVSRAEVDVLRALLHNCARHGPSTQNREAHPAFPDHVRGRVAWVAQHDPRRGARLLAAYEAIDWAR